jgi:hypothetical protein
MESRTAQIPFWYRNCKFLGPLACSLLVESILLRTRAFFLIKPRLNIYVSGLLIRTINGRRGRRRWNGAFRVFLRCFLFKSM